jgi:(E)-4-hydroxy-3-methylbut-2-enyl-diphosphate synthase
MDGIGDTIRVSLTPRPGGDRAEEVRVAQQILQSLGIRNFEPQVTACPGCGRTTSTFFQEMAEDIQGYLRARMPEWREVYPGVEGLDVAVMGCVVNGPGEAEGADVAIFAGDRKGIIYVQGARVANVPEEEILDRLLLECRKFQDQVERGEAKLGEKKVDILPPDPIGELGSGFDKIAAGNVETIPSGKVTPLTISRG